jgi:hypothetical protein
MDQRYRDILARYLLEIRQLSECKAPRSAIIAGGPFFLRAAVNRLLAGEQETSAVSEVIVGYFQDFRHVHEKEPFVLFSSYFPSLEEFKLLLKTNIRKIYYLGDIGIENEETVNFINRHTVEKQGESLEIINLKISEDPRKKTNTA